MSRKPTANDLLLLIRKHCLVCSGGSRKEARNCLIKDCLLYPYRIPEEEKPKRERTRTEGQISIFDLKISGGI